MIIDVLQKKYLKLSVFKLLLFNGGLSEKIFRYLDALLVIISF
jgi:hypothetical protein